MVELDEVDLHGLTPGPRFQQWRGEPVEFIALDVDGTASPNGIVVADEVVSAVSAAQQAGIVVGAATGRSIQLMQATRSRIDFDGPLLLQNGAELWIDGAPVHRTWMGVDNLARVRDLAISNGAALEVYGETGWFIWPDAEFRDRLRRYLASARELSPEPLPDTAGTDAVKATIVLFDEQTGRRMSAAVHGLGLESEPHVVPTEHGHVYLNITAPGVTKGTAIPMAAELAGTTLERTMVVGDGANDIPMLAPAGTAVVMGQSIPEVKAHAHFIAPDVASHGAAAALRFAVAGLASGR